MDWTSLRKRFDSPHLRMVKYKQTKGVRLENKTYAFLYNQDQESLDQDTGQRRCAERIEIELFTKTIITLYPDGYFIPTNHNYWRPGTTRDRYRRYLPYSGHVTSWTFHAFSRLNQYVPTKRYVWAFWMSGTGSHPWKNKTVYDPSGRRDDLSPTLNTADANELCRSIQVYAATCVNELYAGDVSMKDKCNECQGLLERFQNDIDEMKDPRRSLKFDMQAHFFRHVVKNIPSLPLLVWAVETFGGYKPALAVMLLMKENQFIWRPARNREAIARQLQQHMLAPDMTVSNLGAHPSHFRKWIRWSIEEHLLNEFGFEIGEC